MSRTVRDRGSWLGQSVVWSLICLLSLAEAGLEQACLPSDYRGSIMGSCGPDLRQFIELVCPGGTYSPDLPAKRQHHKLLSGDDYREPKDPVERDKWRKKFTTKVMHGPYFTMKPLTKYLPQFSDDPTRTRRPGRRVLGSLRQAGRQDNMPLPDDDIFLSRNVANSFLSRRLTRRKRAKYISNSVVGPDKGIVCECCVNSCNVFELQQYCVT